MSPVLLTAILLAATPEPVKLAAPGLNGANISEEVLTFYTEHFAQQLGFQGVRVTTSSEIAQLIGFERQKEMLGCKDDSTSCLVELANALGVDGLVNGSIARLGKSYALNLKIVSATDARPLAAWSSRVPDEEAVLDELNRAAKAMAAEMFQKLGRTPPEKKVTQTTPTVATTTDPIPTEVTEPSGSASRKLNTWAFVPIGAGVLAAGAGTFFVMQGNGAAAKIQASGPDVGAARDAYETGKRDQTIGVSLIGVGAAAALAGGGWLLFGGSDDAQVAFMPSTSPGVVASGSFDEALWFGVLR